MKAISFPLRHWQAAADYFAEEMVSRQAWFFAQVRRWYGEVGHLLSKAMKGIPYYWENILRKKQAIIRYNGFFFSRRIQSALKKGKDILCLWRVNRGYLIGMMRDIPEMMLSAARRYARQSYQPLPKILPDWIPRLVTSLQRRINLLTAMWDHVIGVLQENG